MIPITTLLWYIWVQMDFYPAPHCPALAFQTRSQAWIFMILYDNSPLFHVKTYVNSQICTFEPTWSSVSTLPRILSTLRASLTTVAFQNRKYCSVRDLLNNIQVWCRFKQVIYLLLQDIWLPFLEVAQSTAVVGWVVIDSNEIARWPMRFPEKAVTSHADRAGSISRVSVEKWQTILEYSEI